MFYPMMAEVHHPQHTAHIPPSLALSSLGGSDIFSEYPPLGDPVYLRQGSAGTREAGDNSLIPTWAVSSISISPS